MNSDLKLIKKQTIYVVLLLGCLCLSGCSSNTSEPDIVIHTKAPTTEPTEERSIVSFIGSRTVDYYEATKEHRVFWQFLDQNEVPITPDGNITITITNENGETVYSQTHQVTENDYTEWNNQTWDEPKLLGCIYIPDSALLPGSSNTGILTLSAESQGASFDPQDISIRNLPLVDFVLNIPQLPYSLNNYSYQGQIDRSITISNIDYEYNNGHLTINYTAEMTYNSKGSTHSDHAYIGYKVKDSSGIVVDSGSTLIGPLSVGDIIKAHAYIYDLKLGETYTLELIDVD